MLRILVIIPAYNEEANIVSLIRTLRALPEKPDVLVVDDGNDRTAELVAAEGMHEHETVSPRAERGAAIRVLKRASKGGRGSAVLAGIRQGLDEGYDLLVEMDADFSHDPAALPSLLALAEPNVMVIGSRYLPGSKIINWPLKRRVFSRLANFYATMILNLGITDYTNGYRVYGRTAAECLDASKIRSTGYIVLSEIAWQLSRAGCWFKEAPITFVNRTRGGSNFSLHEISESFAAVWRIRFNKSK